MWYGGFIAGNHFDTGQGSDRVNAWHYANSSDGVSWEKPSLGLFDLASVPQCSAAAKAAGTNNNILVGGDGAGMFYDSIETNSSRKFKAFGTLCPQGGAMIDQPNEFGASASSARSTCVSGTAISSDGINFDDFQPISWPAPQRYDCHQNICRDPADHTLVYTTRDGFSKMPGRTIGMTRGPEGGAWGNVDTSKAPKEVESGTDDHQLYAQVTFPFYNTWLGLVAVFDTRDPRNIGTVHTRLSWANSSLGPWQWLEPAGLTGPSIVPLGSAGEFDSHIVFPAHTPFVDPSDGQIRLYYAGGNGPHNGARNTSMGLATLRPDGFGGIGGSGSWQSVPIMVSGELLTISADVKGSTGSVLIGAPGHDGISMADAIPIGESVTDEVVRFTGGGSFSNLLGKMVVLEVAMVDATVFTIGFKRT